MQKIKNKISKIFHSICSQEMLHFARAKMLHHLGGITSALRNFFQAHGKQFALVSTALVLAIVIMPHLTFAQDAAAPTSSAKADEIYSGIAAFLTVILQFLQKLVWPILLLIGGLMKNDILFDAGMESLMLSIWSNIRNLVNIIFVLVLLGIAFYNVMGLGQNYHIKTILPKFIIALIAVNFSFLACKVVLDGVSVVSTAIFAMPSAVQEKLGENPLSGKEKEICQSFFGKNDSEYKKKLQETKQKGGLLPPFCNENYGFTDSAKQFFSKFDAGNAGIVMAINLAQISKLDEVKVTEANIKNLFLNILFSVVFYIVYATAFVALFVVLLTRLIVLWTTIVLSPLVVLKYVLPDSISSKLGEAGKLDETFLNHALVPIPIALVMTIGFIMLEGLHKTQFKSLTLLTQTSSIDFLTSGMSTLQDIIVALGMVGVVWAGVFAAAAGTKAEGAVNTIKETVGGAGKFLAGAWKYAPIFPMKVAGKEQRVSLAGVMGVKDEIESSLRQKARSETQSILPGMSGGDINAALAGIRSSQTAKDLVTEARRAGAAGPQDKDVQKELGYKLKNSLKISNELDFTNLGNDKDGKKYDKKRFIEDLNAGNARPEAVEKFLRDNEKKLGVDESAPKPAPTTTPDKNQPTGVVASETADAILADPETLAYQQALDKKALDKYKGAKTGAAKDQALREAQDSLGKLEKLQSQGADMRSKVAKVKTAQELDALVSDRKKELESQGIQGNAADDILRVELEPLNSSDASEAVKAARDGSQTAQAILSKPLVQGSRPASTPASSSAPKPAATPAPKPPVTAAKAQEIKTIEGQLAAKKAELDAANAAGNPTEAARLMDEATALQAKLDAAKK